MRLKLNDTCGCDFDFEPNGDRDQTLVKFHWKCPMHTGMSDVDAHRDALDINQSKNMALALFQKNHPELFPEVVLFKIDKLPSTVVLPPGFQAVDSADGKTEIKLQVQYSIGWAIKPDGSISIKLPPEVSAVDKSLMNATKKELPTPDGPWKIKKNVSYD